MQFVISFKKL